MTSSGRSLLCFVGASLALWTLPCPAGSSNDGTINAAQYSIAGVTVGSSEPQIVKAFGKPLSERRYFSELAQAPAAVLKYSWGSVRLSAGETEQISTESPRHRLPSGVRVGDPRARVISIYGHAESWVSEGVQVDRYNLRRTDCYLSFYSKNGRIVRIVLWYDNT